MSFGSFGSSSYRGGEGSFHIPSSVSTSSAGESYPVLNSIFGKAGSLALKDPPSLNDALASTEALIRSGGSSGSAASAFSRSSLNSDCENGLNATQDPADKRNFRISSENLLSEIISRRQTSSVSPRPCDPVEAQNGRTAKSVLADFLARKRTSASNDIRECSSASLRNLQASGGSKLPMVKNKATNVRPCYESPVSSREINPARDPKLPEVVADLSSASTDLRSVVKDPSSEKFSGLVYVDVSKYVHLPQSEAAKFLSMPASTLSKRWKEAQLNRKWPFPRIKEIDSRIADLENKYREHSSSSIQRQIEVLKAARAEETRSVMLRQSKV